MVEKIKRRWPSIAALVIVLLYVAFLLWVAQFPPSAEETAARKQMLIERHMPIPEGELAK